MRYNDIVTSVVIAHRQNVVRKISEFFLEIRSKEVVNISSSVGIIIVHHMTPVEGTDGNVWTI